MIISLCSFFLDFKSPYTVQLRPYIKKGSGLMSLKEKLYEEVKESTVFTLNFEHQRLKAQLDDCVSALKDSLTPTQRIMLDKSILLKIDEIMEFQQYLTFDASFSATNRAWRELILGDRYEIEDFETSDSRTVTEEDKKLCADRLVRMILDDLMRNNRKDLIDSFKTSDTVKLLYDFKTELWKERPNYILERYADEKEIYIDFLEEE